MPAASALGARAGGPRGWATLQRSPRSLRWYVRWRFLDALIGHLGSDFQKVRRRDARGPTRACAHRALYMHARIDAHARIARRHRYTQCLRTPPPPSRAVTKRIRSARQQLARMVADVREGACVCARACWLARVCVRVGASFFEMRCVLSLRRCTLSLHVCACAHGRVSAIARILRCGAVVRIESGIRWI